MTKSAVILRRLLCVIIVLSALLTLPNRVSSQTGTKVTLPVSSNVFTCQSSLIPVRVDNVTSLTAYHLEIDFPPGDVQVTAVENGGFIPNGIFEPTNAIDNVAGTVVFGMARQNYDTPPANGSGVLIYLSVQGVNPGAAVNFTIRPYVAGTEPTNGSGSMLVGWPDLTPIPYTITNGTMYTQSCISTDIQLSNNQINENLPLGSAIGTFTTIDPDGSAGFSYAFWDTEHYPDNVYFTISGNELRTNAAFNFETDSSYSIRVRSWSDVDPYFYKTFTIIITDANDPPVLGVIGAQSVNEHALLAFTATATDEDTLPAPDTLTYSLANGTSGLVPTGAAIDASTGGFTWTPVEDQGPGNHTFDVCVSDGLASDCETVTVTVNEINAAPSGADGTVNALEDIGRVFVTTDFGFSDLQDIPANALLAVKITTLPGAGLLTSDGTPVSAGGSVSAADIAAGKLVFTPAANVNGAAYASFTFQVQDDGGTAGGGIDLDQTPNTLTIDLTSVNDAPVANGQAKSVAEDTPLSITLTGSDVEGSSLTYSIVTGPSHGTLSGSGATRTYTPAVNYNGADSFTFKANDGTVDSDPATVSITVTPVNDAPVANAQARSVIEDTATSITLTGSDVDGNPLTYSIVTLPTHGTLSGSGATRTYTPAANYNGADSFTFRVYDGADYSSPATVSITVTPVNDAPAANGQAKSVAEDTPLSITLTGSDVEGGPLTYSIVTQPSHGTLSGSGAAWTYTPAANYNGADSFTFRVHDGADYSPAATVSITVTPVNDAPVGVADHYYLNNVIFIDTDDDKIYDTYKLIANVDPAGVLQNDSDVDGDMLSATVKTNVTKGVLVLNSNGSFIYTLNQSLLQDAVSFVYTLSDGHGGSKDVTVNITIDVVGPAEVAQWLTPINAPAGSSNYYGMIYDASTPTVPLKVFVNNTSDVAKVEFRWYDHTQTPGVWQIIGVDETPTWENNKYVYTATLNADSMPFVDDIQLWAYTYDAAGSYTRIVKVNNYDYYARILVNHKPSGYNVFLPLIRR